MEEAILRGSLIEPLIITDDIMELMDGYTRYMILKNYKQSKVYRYIRSLREEENLDLNY